MFWKYIRTTEIYENTSDRKNKKVLEIHQNDKTHPKKNIGQRERVLEMRQIIKETYGTTSDNKSNILKIPQNQRTYLEIHRMEGK